MTNSSEDHRAGIEAALHLAGTRRWSELNLIDICQEAGRPLEQYYDVSGPGGLARALEGYLDLQMSAEACDTDDPARLRLFDVIMLRFEAMEPYRSGLTSYFEWRDRSVTGLAIRFSARLKTAAWALSCAGLNKSDGVPEGLREAALAWVISRAENAWRQETGPDLSRTMAALDAELIKAESRMLSARKLMPQRSAAGAGQAGDADGSEVSPADLQ